MDRIKLKDYLKWAPEGSFFINPLNMVAQLQFNGMGVQVDLFFKIRLIIFSYVMIHERHGNDEGKNLSPIEIDDFKQLLLFTRRQLFLEIAHHVHQHIGVFLRGGLQLKGFQEEGLILLIKIS
jgi:hypothetical protein